MSRIAEKFADLKRANSGGFIPFITAGHPDLKTTELLLSELAAAGADFIELGVPFSDPVADGEVIQCASAHALRQGVTVGDVLRCVARVRRRIDTPIVLFSYFNPLLQFPHFAKTAEKVGLDGVLVTDLLPEDAQDWSQELRRRNIDPIFLVALTTSEERLARIAKQASGFVYAISRTGVTGAPNALTSSAEKLVGRIRALTDIPVAVGFGVSTAEQVKEVWRFADAAVIGSAIVREIEKLNGAPDLVSRIGDFARALISARDATARLPPGPWRSCASCDESQPPRA